MFWKSVSWASPLSMISRLRRGAAQYCGARRGKRGADQPKSPSRGFLGMWGPVGFWEGTPALHDSE